MAPKITIPKSTRKTMHKLLMPHIRAAAERVEAACNAESSWGFYKAYHDDDASRVAVLSAGAKDGRSNRLVRNIEAGRVR